MKGRVRQIASATARAMNLTLAISNAGRETSESVCAGSYGRVILTMRRLARLTGQTAFAFEFEVVEAIPLGLRSKIFFILVD